MKVISKQSGFTLVELMIALAVFSMAIVVLTISFVGLVRTQRVAGEDRATQQDARKIIEEIVRDVRSASSVVKCPDSPGRPNVPSLLVDKVQDKLYYFLDSSDGGAMMVAASNGCTPSAGTPRQLTSGRVEVDSFDFTVITDAPDPTAISSYAVDVSVKLKLGLSETNFRTAAATRGESPSAGEIDPDFP